MAGSDRVAGWRERLAPLAATVAALIAAGACASVIIALAGAPPWATLAALAAGAAGSSEALSYTLFHATDFIFAGLAVAVAFQAGLFNIGGEGQTVAGGIGLSLAALALPGLPSALAVPLAVVAAAGFGAAWGWLPGWLQARRGSHVVITTIMFNFIAAALLGWLLVDVLIPPGGQAPESAEFGPGYAVTGLAALAGWFGIGVPETPLNLCFLFALAAAGLYGVILDQTVWGLELRAVGLNPHASRHAGISPARVTIAAMAASGALAGLIAVNQLLGAHHRLIADFSGGAGFVGIAVALVGRNHPLGIVLAGLLFGALAQGGSELPFVQPLLNRDVVVVIQGVVILFAALPWRPFVSKP